MKRNIYLKILTGIITLVVLLLFLKSFVIAPWIGKTLEAKFNDNIKGYIVEIEKVHMSILTSGLKIDSITIYSRQEHAGVRDLKGQIASIKLNRINLTQAIFKKDIVIGEVIISNTNIKGMIQFPEKIQTPIISSLNLRIDSLFFDKIELAIQNTSNAQAYLVKKGVLKISGLMVEKHDTLFPGIVNHFDFDAEEFLSVTADSMQTFKANGIVCSERSNTLLIDSFSIHPNYKDYDFTNRHKFQTDRIEARLSSISVRDFSAADYIKSGKIVSSYIEIGKLDVKAFRDKRKKFRHVNKPAFQDLIYNYPHKINIDSIGFLEGNVTYSEHTEKANEPGSISFNEIKVNIYKITNDTIYKTEKAYLDLKAEAMLMGKGKITVLLKGRIFDRHNTFSMNGTLSGMDARALNPMLGKNAFLDVTTGKIDAMNFSFTANNTRASGKMILLYHGLKIAVINKQTDDKSAIKEQVSSVIANIKVLNSNPLRGKEIREGIIENERDPERFVFNYCFKSILSGIKSSLVKSPK